MGSRLRAGLVVVCLFSCSSGRATHLFVSVDSDMNIPGELSCIEVSVRGPTRTTITRFAPNGSTVCGTDAIAVRLPLRFPIVPAQGTPADAEVTITATGLLGGAQTVRTQARARFENAQQRTVDLFLARSCIGQACSSGYCGRTGCIAGPDGGVALLDASSDVAERDASARSDQRDSALDASAPSDAVADAGRDGGPAICPPRVDIVAVVDPSLPGDARRDFGRNLASLVRGIGGGVIAGMAFTGRPDINVGILTTDLGTGTPGGCTPMHGDDGVFVLRPEQTTGACTTGGGPMRPNTYMQSRVLADVNTLSSWISCFANVTGSTCVIEQTLESALKALVPSTRTNRSFFPGDAGGNALVPSNNGFLRPDSLLVLVVATNEDDCSALAPSMFDPTRDAGPLAWRCRTLGVERRSVNALVVRLSELQSPDRFMMMTIAGVPPSARTDTIAGYDGLLADQLPEVVAPDASTTNSDLQDVCSFGLASAKPARRLVQVARGLLQQANPPTVFVRSVCAASYDGAFADLASRIAARLTCM